jgi:hypothetical protein
VRHTGSDRRRRLPAPCQQHRHEQLQPLQQHIRSFAHTRSSRQEGRRALPTAAEHSALRAVPCVCNPGSGIRLEHPGEHRGVPSVECRLEYPDVCPAVLCAGLVAAVHAHRQAHWQVGHGFLGLPNRTIERARHSLGGRRGSGEKPRRRSARQVCQVRIAKPARRVGPTADAKCAMGVEQRVADCVRRATCARRCAARRAWQRSVWRRAWHGMTTKLPGRALGVHALLGCKRGHAAAPSVRPLHQTGP